MERLQKFIAHSGFCSRRKAEELITAGKVMVNNQVVKELGTKVDVNDKIVIDGQKLKVEKKEYYLLYKPKSIISSTNDEHDRMTVVDLIDKSKVRLYPVGRLDYDTTGVIILTNDGEFANEMMHPSSKIKKTYVAYVDGLINAEQIKNLEQGVILDKKKTAKAKAKILKKDFKNNNSVVRLTIIEGRNHQVKRMFEQVGLNVRKLHREQYGILDVRGLEPGEYRKIKADEIADLRKLAKGELLNF